MTTGADASAERLARLEAFERQHRLFDLRCDDWSAWRMLRHFVHRAITTERQPVASGGGHGGPSRGRIAAAIAQLARHLIAPPRADVIVMAMTSALRDQAGDTYRDIYFDDLFDSGLTAFKIERRNASGLDARSAAAAYPAQLDSLAIEYLARVIGRVTPLPQPMRAFCRQLSSLVSTEFQIDLPVRWLERTVSSTRAQTWLYERLFRRVKPKALLVADTAEYPLLIASRRAGIRSIELQHGVFDRTHADAFPAQPGVDRAALILPDALAAYGGYWKRELEGTAFTGDWVRPVGSAFIEKIRALRAQRPASETYAILATTQGIAREEFVQWLEDFVAAAPADFDWKLRIKLHPSYDPSVEPYRGLMASGRVEVIAGHANPATSDLLADADLHISISSAVHFDALSIGVPTVILPLPSHEIIRSVADDRAAFVARDPGDIWRIIRRVPEVPDQGHDFCAPGYVQNLRALIDAL